jgi:hypothetical protein
MADMICHKVYELLMSILIKINWKWIYIILFIKLAASFNLMVTAASLHPNQVPII